MKPVIEIQGLTKSYKLSSESVYVLNGVDLKIGEGEFVAIMGSSGSGKSTLLQILGLLDTPNSGSYQLYGEEVSKYNDNQLAQLRSSTIGFIFQQFHLLARTTAWENVALPSIYSGLLGAEERAKQLLDTVGLSDRILHKPNELSGGQQQRVAIARSLINHPKVLLADEPTGNLDSKSKQEVMQILKTLNQTGITVVMVTHETEIANYCDRVVFFSDGKITRDTQNKKPDTQQETASANLQSYSDKDIHLSKNSHSKETTSIQYKSKTNFIESFIGYFRSAAKTLLSNKARTALSAIGILIGVMALLVVMALGEGAKQSIEEQLSSMGSNLLIVKSGSRKHGGVSMEAGAVTRLTYEDGHAIQSQIKGVVNLSSSISGRGQAVYKNKNWNTNISGVESNYASMRNYEPTTGRFFTEKEDQSRSLVAVLGKKVNEELFGDRNAINEFIKINKINFRVIGVFPEKGGNSWKDEDDTIVLPLQTTMYRLFNKQYIDRIEIEMASIEDMPEAEEQILSLLYKRHRVSESMGKMFQINNLAEIQDALSKSSQTMSMLLLGVAAISLLVGGIGIMNIMLVSVKERTREIGLRKALGANKRDILLQFLVESVMISVFGGVSGIIAGQIATYAMTIWAEWTATVSTQAILFSFFFSLVTGVVFGLWPARQAAELNPIVALRYE